VINTIFWSPPPIIKLDPAEIGAFTTRFVVCAALSRIATVAVIALAVTLVTDKPTTIVVVAEGTV
jgi:hypothetical protein